MKREVNLTKSVLFIGFFNGLITMMVYLTIHHLFFDYLIALGFSLIVPFVIVTLYLMDNQTSKKGLALLTLTTGITFLIIGWLGVWLFPPTIIRDLGDIVGPYINVLFACIVLMGVTYGYGNHLLVTSHKR